MAQGISIHIGVNEFDPAHYGSKGTLRACEFDARDMHQIAQANGYQSMVLLTRDATTANVIQALQDAAARLQSGDILFLTYAGHGAQVPDVDEEEPDRRDETWCLYDRMLVDDELYRLWAQFKPGVRILMLSDSCHSGSVARKVIEFGDQVRSLRGVTAVEERAADAAGAEETRPRTLQPDEAAEVYARNADLYDEIQVSGPGSEQLEVAASVLLISGCQDNQTSADGTKNGLFTATLKGVWRDGQFKGDYNSLHRKIVQRMPITQSPNLFRTGAPHPDFERQRPFSIG